MHSSLNYPEMLGQNSQSLMLTFENCIDITLFECPRNRSCTQV